jgi:hypothetical protein
MYNFAAPDYSADIEKGKDVEMGEMEETKDP